MRWTAILFFLSFVGCAGCKEEPTPPPYLPPGSGSGTGGTSNDSTDAGADGAAKAEPTPAEIPETARVQLMISTEYVENRVPKEATAVTMDETPRIWIYAFWRGLEVDHLYKETFIICPPDKAESCDDGWVISREFVPHDTPQNPTDAIYVKPFGWMTVVGFDLSAAKPPEPLGNWTVSVWPTGQKNGPSDEKMLEVM